MFAARCYSTGIFLRDRGTLLKQITYKPATKKQWKNMEELFAQYSLVNGCWCMYWRMKRKEFNQGFGGKNKARMKQLIDSGKVPGILAYDGRKPIAWCSIAPREDYPVLKRSPVLKPVDEKPVWSIVCFFVLEQYRKKGMMKALIKAAMKYAKGQGAKLIEAYPVIRKASKDPTYQLYTGVFSVFKEMGFKVVARRSKIRPIMRKPLQ
jgi:GNAT superfamily N-acetyltransferase